MNLLISFVVSLLTSLAKAWFSQQTTKQEGAREAEDNAITNASEAVAIRDSVKPLTVDQLQSHTASNDPDFRD